MDIRCPCMGFESGRQSQCVISSMICRRSSESREAGGIEHTLEGDNGKKDEEKVTWKLRSFSEAEESSVPIRWSLSGE